MRNFTEDEFECKCGCGANRMDENVLARLDNARDIAAVPFHVNSGYRCAAHNRAEGSKDTSSHPKGLAVDIRARDSVTRFHVIDGLIRAGFRRIGIAKTFIHADHDESKAPGVAWMY